MNKKILVVDDDEVMRRLLLEVLQKSGYSVKLSGSAEEALQLLKTESYPVILSDIRMLELDGLAMLRDIKSKGRQCVVILMTGFGSMEGALEAIQEGAFDYVSKPFKMEELKTLTQRAWDHWNSLYGIHVKQSAPALGKMNVSQRGLVGCSSKIVEVYKTLARAALSMSNVMITGESGTGKELVARAIHENGQRRNKKLVSVNCGALTETLLESELFGYTKGAFTGAQTDRKGLFEDAHGGTLFLDEVGDITPALQVKLLRVIQEGEYKPVGSTENKKSDIRFIAATHRNLEELIKTGKFREDLYYRLKVIPIELPPLRDRIEDLPELVNHFLALLATKSKKTISHVSEDAMLLLQAYSWPGNIRELEHAIEHAIAMTRTAVLFPEDFPNEIQKGAGPFDAGGMSDIQKEGFSAQSLVKGSLEDVEREHILSVLQQVGFNKSKASDVLGIDRATLYRKAQRYGIDLRGK